MYTQIVKPNLLRVFLSVILATIFTLFSWSFDLDTAQELGEEELEQVDEEILVTAQKHMEDNNIGQAAFFKDKDGKHAAFFLSPKKENYIFTKDSQGNVIKKGGKSLVNIDNSTDYLDHLHLKRIEIGAKQKQHNLEKIQSKAQGKIETKYDVKQLSSENNHSMLIRGKELKELYNNIGGAVEVSYAPSTTIADYKGLLKEKIKDQYNVTPIGSENLEKTFDRGKGLQELYKNVGQKLESSRKYQDTEKFDHYYKFLQSKIDKQYDVTPVSSESLKQTLERGKELRILRDSYGKEVKIDYSPNDNVDVYKDKIVKHWSSASGLSIKSGEKMHSFINRAKNKIQTKVKSTVADAPDSKGLVVKGKPQQPPTSQQKGIMQGKKPQQHSQAAPDSVKEAEQMKPEVKQKTEEARGAARTIAREKEKDIQQKTKEKSWFSKLFDSDQDKE